MLKTLIKELNHRRNTFQRQGKKELHNELCYICKELKQALEQVNKEIDKKIGACVPDACELDDWINGFSKGKEKGLKKAKEIYNA